jgi:hypothetical protein
VKEERQHRSPKATKVLCDSVVYISPKAAKVLCDSAVYISPKDSEGNLQTVLIYISRKGSKGVLRQRMNSVHSAGI